MKYISFLFFVYSMIWIIGFHSVGYAFLNDLKSNIVNFFYYSSTKIKDYFSLKLLWSHVIGCGACGYYVNLYPAYQGSYIFSVDYYGMVKKLAFDTGKCLWSKDLSGSFLNGLINKPSLLFSHGVVVNNNCLYLGSELAKVYALDAETGAIMWIADVSGSVISRPIINNGLVVVYTSDGVLQALDKRTGITKWVTNFEIPSFNFRVTLLPVIFSDKVIFGDAGGTVNACALDTGQLIWERKISNLKGITDIDRLSNIVAPVVVDNVVYVIAYNGNMVALDALSGDLIWSRNIGSLINIIVEDNFIYLIDQDNHIVLLNKSNGNIIWNKSTLIHYQLTSISLYKGYILIGDSKGSLYCFSKKDGSYIGQVKIGCSYFNQPMILFDKIVFYEHSGKLSVWSIT